MVRKSIESWPKIQVALDFIREPDAIHVGKLAYLAGVEWVEAGTPLIKSEGAHAIRALKSKLPQATIVADMKTLDAGRVEMEIAYNAGADVVSISGLSHDRTIIDSARVRDEYDRLLMVDLMMVPSLVKRAGEIERLGADIICMHTGLDVQRATRSRLVLSPALRRIARTSRVPVAAAGGLNPRLARSLVEAGIKILIVGGWITGSADPYKASLEMVSSLPRVGMETD